MLDLVELCAGACEQRLLYVEFFARDEVQALETAVQQGFEVALQVVSEAAQVGGNGIGKLACEIIEAQFA